MTPGTVHAIFIAPRARIPLVGVQSVRAVPGRGLEGDRYHAGVGAFSRWPDSGRAVTLIEAEAIEAIAREHGIDLSGGRSRRNLVTTGVRLEEFNGRRFRIGGAVMRGSRLCAPCHYLERLVGPGTYKAMTGRGGLRADVLEEGEVRVGDPIELLPTNTPSPTDPREAS